MNKRKFLKELEKRLEILTKTEKEDIINEYRDIIEEKVKHGKTEEEAVKEFGSINELSKEILSAYKINPEYQEDDEPIDIMGTTENLIKKGAKKLSEVTEDVVDSLKKSDVELTTETIFEIIIKVLVVLLGLAILKLPFWFVGELGATIFNIGFAPFSWISEVVWKILVEVIYLIACALVLFTIISKYVKPKNKNEKTNRKEESYSEEIETSKKKVTNEPSTSWNVVLTILKGFVCIMFLFPLWCANFGLLVAIAYVIYILMQGINIVGILILLLGCVCIGFEFCHIIYSLLFTRKHYHFSSLVIGFVMVLIGAVLTFDYMSDFTYYNTLPSDLFKEGTITYEEILDSKTSIDADKLEIIIDNSIEDSKMKMEVSYYKDYVRIEKEHYTHDDHKHIYFEMGNVKSSFNWKRDVKDLLIKHLEKKEIYNYSLLDDVKVKVYVNEHTKSLLE